MYHVTLKRLNIAKQNYELLYISMSALVNTMYMYLVAVVFKGGPQLTKWAGNSRRAMLAETTTSRTSTCQGISGHRASPKGWMGLETDTVRAKTSYLESQPNGVGP